MYNIRIRLDDRFISPFVFPLIPRNGTFGISYTNNLISRLRRSPLILQQCPIFIFLTLPFFYPGYAPEHPG